MPSGCGQLIQCGPSSNKQEWWRGNPWENKQTKTTLNNNVYAVVLTNESAYKEWQYSYTYDGRGNVDKPVWKEWSYSKEYNVV